jgi:vibriolysin
VLNGLWAAHSVDLFHAPYSTVLQFKNLNDESLKKISSVNGGKQLITRYQHYYKGVPVIGSQAIVVKGASIKGGSWVNGHMIKDISLDIVPRVNPQQAIQQAKAAYFAHHAPIKTNTPKAVLQIREDRENESTSLRLTYLVSFTGINDKGVPVAPTTVIDAQTGETLLSWDNIQQYSDTGPGGNLLIGKYWYGLDGLPVLSVPNVGATCTMDDPGLVRVVNMAYDTNRFYNTAYSYTCGQNLGDPINGGYSPINDAYYFSHLVTDMYNQYGFPVLGGAQLIVRVHYGAHMANAFWDPATQMMSFGDGDGYYYYPFTTLDVFGHEASHGFTEQNSGLEYHDESGALNESFSDMAGLATRAYLFGTDRVLYNSISRTSDVLNWYVGEAIPTPLNTVALRYMHIPSADGFSSDCVDRRSAIDNGSLCEITEAELLAYANIAYSDAGDRNSFIVHTNSGVFNRAFYLLSQAIGVHDAFAVMLRANMQHWGPTTNFSQGACGVMNSASELSINTGIVRTVFKKVGVVPAAVCP